MTPDPHEHDGLFRALVNAGRSELPPPGAKGRALARLEGAEGAWVVRVAASALAVVLVVTTLGTQAGLFARRARSSVALAVVTGPLHVVRPRAAPMSPSCSGDVEAPIDACGYVAGASRTEGGAESGGGSSSGGAPRSSSG